MDSKFYRFWEDFIQQAAAGRVSSGDFSSWMGQEEAPEELMKIFKKYYGLDQMAPDTTDYSEFFESAIKEFNDSLANFYSMIDVVPKKDYLQLEKKFKILKQKVADQEEVIKHLKLLFKTSPDTDEGVKALNQMLKSQNENFLQMMESLADFYGISKDKDADKSKD